MKRIEPKHPISGDTLTALERCLIRFRWTANEAQVLLRGLHIAGRGGDVTRYINDDLFFSLFNHGMILVCKFLEVWDDFGAVSKQEPRVIDVRRALTPFIDRINSWPGLLEFRNTALAHPYLTKEGNLADPQELLAQTRAPTYHAEVILLLHCVNFTVLGVLQCYADEFQQLEPIVYGRGAQPGKGKGISRGYQIVDAIKPLASEAEMRLTKLGIVMTGPLSREFALAVNPDRFKPTLRWKRAWLQVKIGLKRVRDRVRGRV